MRGHIIVQQTSGLGCLQIRPHVRDLFQQLVEHTFVEVRVHRLPRRNKLSMDHAVRIKKCDQHRLHVRFLPLQFFWSRRPLAHPFRTLSFGSRVVHKTPRSIPRHNCGQKCRVAVMRHEKVFARGHVVCFFVPLLTRAARSECRFFLPRSLVMM